MKKRSTLTLAVVTALMMLFTAVPAFAADPSPGIIDLSKGSIKATGTSGTYNGKKQKSNSFKVYTQKGTAVSSSDYKITKATSTSSANAGKYTLTVTATGQGARCKGTVTGKYTYTIKKASQKIKVSTSSKTVKASKKKVTYSSAIKVSGVKTSATFKKLKGYSKITIKGKKFAVYKNAKKGTYKIKVKVTAKSGKNYNKASKTATIKVRVK